MKVYYCDVFNDIIITDGTYFYCATIKIAKQYKQFVQHKEIPIVYLGRL